MDGKLSLTISLDWWGNYQELLKGAIAPLNAEHLALRLGPDRRAVGQIAAHIVMARAWYLRGVMGEGGPEFEPLFGWDDEDAPLRSSAELVWGIDQTWALLAGCLSRWTADELQGRFYINWLGHDAPRSWIIWHVLEHELHHGGELSFTLGGNGLAGLDV